MNTQSEALRLADAIAHPHQEPNWKTCEQAAAELRRLHALNQELLEVLKDAVRDSASPGQWIDEARAAIAKAEAA